MTESTLAGATVRPEEGHRIADAGQYAAVWNALTPEQRERWFRDTQEALEMTGNLIVRNLIAIPREDLGRVYDDRLERVREGIERRAELLFGLAAHRLYGTVSARHDSQVLYLSDWRFS